MKRRSFIKTTLAGGAGAAFLKMPVHLYGAVDDGEDVSGKTYTIGEKISADAFVLNKELEKKKLLSLVQENKEAFVHVLYIFGGGAMAKEDKLGQIWCRDSFEDLQVLRFIQTKYEEYGVSMIPVALAPVYSTQHYGFDAGVLMNEADDSKKFQDAAASFVNSTQQSYEAGFIPVQPYFDLRNRLLLNPAEDLKPGEDYGKIHAWQGRFRAENETQKYGVPTIWLLNAEGVILEGPFYGNYYHSDPYTINYTLVDIDKAIEKYL